MSEYVRRVLGLVATAFFVWAGGDWSSESWRKTWEALR